MAAILPVDPKTAAPKARSGDPSSPSSDYSASARFWKMANDILGGAETMRAQAHESRIGGPAHQLENVPSQHFSNKLGVISQSPYLPKFPNEPDEEYDRRRRNAFFTNIYGDISGNLSSKPFSKTCELEESAGEDLKKLSENIDGLGNNLHVFARDVFKTAIDKGITWILSDYTTVPPGANLAEERDMGARTYWVHVPAEKLLAVYSKFLDGKEIIFHARIDEPTVELDGYEEKTIKRVRELNREPITNKENKIIGFGPATWKVFQEDTTKDPATGKQTSTWNEIASGDITIGIIPLIPIILGKRDGTSWRVSPPLRDLAYMQVKLFQMESNLDCTKELTAFPMLTGNGINGLDEKGQVIKVPVGPRGVLFAPAMGNGSPGSWGFIEPSGSSLQFLSKSIEDHKTEMRDLGMQPLTASNLTVVTTTNVARKAHNAVQAWALMLKDALEQTWKITGMWLKQNVEPEVNVHVDFGMDLDAGEELSAVASLQKDGVISKKLRFEESKRRGVIADDVEYDEDQEQLATEQSNEVMSPEAHIDPITGMPVVVRPQEGVLNPPLPKNVLPMNKNKPPPPNKEGGDIANLLAAIHKGMKGG